MTTALMAIGKLEIHLERTLILHFFAHSRALHLCDDVSFATLDRLHCARTVEIKVNAG